MRVLPKVSIFHWLKQRVFLFRSPWRDIVQFILLIAVIAWLMSISTSRLGYYWQWYRIPRYLFRIEDGRLVAGQLIQGLLFTFRISGISLVLVFALGLGTALVRLSSSFVGRQRSWPRSKTTFPDTSGASFLPTPSCSRKTSISLAGL